MSQIVCAQYCTRDIRFKPHTTRRRRDSATRAVYYWIGNKLTTTADGHVELSRVGRSVLTRRRSWPSFLQPTRLDKFSTCSVFSFFFDQIRRELVANSIHTAQHDSTVESCRRCMHWALFATCITVTPCNVWITWKLDLLRRSHTTLCEKSPLQREPLSALTFATAAYTTHRALDLQVCYKHRILFL